jgi:hypothetical protein
MRVTRPRRASPARDVEVLFAQILARTFLNGDLIFVPVMLPARPDPEIAAATFQQHLTRLWASGRPSRLGWERIVGIH